MKYFESYLKDTENNEDIDIRVHCDVNIFAWLMSYIKEEEKPILDLKNVISILISSEFLGIAHLVDICIDFVAQRLADVVRLPIDMSCLNDKLISKLAPRVTIETLAFVRDRKDKLESRIYSKKVEEFVTKYSK